MKSSIQIQLGKISLVVDDSNSSDSNNIVIIALMLDAGHTLQLTEEVGSTLLTPNFMVMYVKNTQEFKVISSKWAI